MSTQTNLPANSDAVSSGQPVSNKPEVGEKIKIAWDDLTTRRVDQRLREQEAVARNRRQAELNPLTSPLATDEPKSIWYNTIFAMTFFGLLGGLLAWGGGEVLHLRGDPEFEARTHLREIADLLNREALGKVSPEEANSGVRALKQEYGDNPFFAVGTDESLSDSARDAKLKSLQAQEKFRTFLTNLLSFGLTGMLIAICLSSAESVVDRNWTAAVVNASVGAAAGLIGGAVVSLFVGKLFVVLSNGASTTDELSSTRILARAICWGVLGLFLTVGPGLVMWNIKKLAIGLLGGLIGGAIGGALFDPILSISNDHISRLAALVAIGVFAGLGTGLIENAAKNGWLKVTAGLIAGKQFILYRSPTFIGSGPECPIYLFRDNQVGKRHAAIHIVHGGFELENLPLGSETLLNGRPIVRTRLRAGDEIKVGMTTFMFNEKVRA